MRRCLDCSALIGAGSRCHNCQRARSQAKTQRSNQQRGGSGYAWQRTRDRIIEEYMGICQHCGRRGTEVDHITPLHQGGTNERRNLTLLCGACHQAKTNRDRTR